MKKGFELLGEAIESGFIRTKQTTLSTFALSFLAGAYVALGGFFAIRLGMAIPWEYGKILFAMVFPIGLMLVVICGADLFTGNCMTLVASQSYGRNGLFEVCRSLVYSWIGNFIGGIFVAYFLVYSTGLIFETINGSMVYADGIIKLANTKTSLDFKEAFLRGVGCNWLVCLAVYASYASKDVIGKIVALWIPTMAFVAMGFEHCVANMFFVPLGILVGHSESYVGYIELVANWGTFFVDNLIPVTLGNFVGGSMLVTGLYKLVYGKP